MMEPHFFILSIDGEVTTLNAATSPWNFKKN